MSQSSEGRGCNRALWDMPFAARKIALGHPRSATPTLAHYSHPALNLHGAKRNANAIAQKAPAAGSTLRLV